MYRQSFVKDYAKTYVHDMSMVNEVKQARFLIIEYDCYRQIVSFEHTFPQVIYLVILNHPLTPLLEPLPKYIQYFEANCIFDQSLYRGLVELHVGQLNIDPQYDLPSSLKYMSGHIVLPRLKSTQPIENQYFNPQLATVQLNYESIKIHLTVGKQESCYINYIKLTSDEDSIPLLKLLCQKYAFLNYQHIQRLSISNYDEPHKLPRDIESLRITNRVQNIHQIKVHKLSLRQWHEPLHFICHDVRVLKINQFNDKIIQLPSLLETLILDQYRGGMFNVPEKLKDLSLKQCDLPLTLPSSLESLIMKDYTKSLLHCTKLRHLELLCFNEHTLKRILLPSLITLKLPQQRICFHEDISFIQSTNIPAKEKLSCSNGPKGTNGPSGTLF